MNPKQKEKLAKKLGGLLDQYSWAVAYADKTGGGGVFSNLQDPDTIRLFKHGAQALQKPPTAMQVIRGGRG